MLKAKLIAERRRELGLSRPDLARRLGFSVGVVDCLEKGTNHLEHNLATLSKLADALGVPLLALFEQDMNRVEAGPVDVRIEAGLAAVGCALSTSDIALSFDLSMKETHAALAALRERLNATGQRLRHSAGACSLIYARDQVTDAELQTLERRRAATNGLRVQEARMLLAVMRGDITKKVLATKNGTIHANAHRLVRLGYAEHHSGGLRLTPAVERSLGLRR